MTISGYFEEKRIVNWVNFMTENRNNLKYTATIWCHITNRFDLESHSIHTTLIMIQSHWCLRTWWITCIDLQVSYYYSHLSDNMKIQKSVTCMRLYFNLFIILDSYVCAVRKIQSKCTLSMFCFLNNLSSKIGQAIEEIGNWQNKCLVVFLFFVFLI